jgi:hypothetical protein
MYVISNFTDTYLYTAQIQTFKRFDLNSWLAQVGELATVLDKRTDSKGKGWCQVQTANGGAIGWIPENTVQENGVFVPGSLSV